MNTKAIIASTLLTVLFATGTSAIAGDNDYVTAANIVTNANNTQAKTFVIKHAYLVSSTVESEATDESGNR